MAKGSIPTLRRRMLGAAVRQLRETARFTAEAAGAELERTGSTISRIESGDVGVRTRDVAALLDLYGLEEPRRREGLLALARQSRHKGWWHTYDDVIPEPYADYISLETDTSSIRTYEVQLIPGLLQTEDYARAVTEAYPWRENNEESDELVAVRMDRQSVVSREEPLQLWAILGEAALRQQVGGPEVTRAQLRHLTEMGKCPNITVQVLPFDAGAHPGIAGSFTILEYPAYTDLDVVLLENMTSGLYLEREDQVLRYSEAFNHLRATALPATKTAAFLKRVIQDL